MCTSRTSRALPPRSHDLEREQASMRYVVIQVSSGILEGGVFTTENLDWATAKGKAL